MERHLETMLSEIEAKSAQLLDVRERLEWDEGHLSLASLVPLSALERGEAPENCPKDLKTYLHCRSGNRVYLAAPLLESLGYSEVVPLDEGFDDLVRAGLARSDDSERG